MTKSNWVLILAALYLCLAPAFAEDPICKSKSGEVTVAYPEIARRLKITGIVRLQVQFDSTGSVHDSKVLGGNPLLATAAQQALHKVKFEGPSPCVAVLEFK